MNNFKSNKTSKREDIVTKNSLDLNNFFLLIYLIKISEIFKPKKILRKGVTVFFYTAWIFIVRHYLCKELFVTESGFVFVKFYVYHGQLKNLVKSVIQFPTFL